MKIYPDDFRRQNESIELGVFSHGKETQRQHRAEMENMIMSNKNNYKKFLVIRISDKPRSFNIQFDNIHKLHASEGDGGVVIMASNHEEAGKIAKNIYISHGSSRFAITEISEEI